MCEETQAYSFRETELGWLGRGWRAGKTPPKTAEGCACVQGPPAPGSPWGESAFPEEPNPPKKRPARILTSGGSQLAMATPQHNSAAERCRLGKQGPRSAPHWRTFKAQSEGASDSADLPRHQRNKSKLGEKRSRGQRQKNNVYIS